MKKKIIVGVLLLEVLVILSISNLKKNDVAVAQEIPKAVAVPTTVPLTVEQMINTLAPKYGQDPKLISKISYCESKHKVASHDGGRALNITGIHDTTFKGWLRLYEKEQGETLDKNSTYDQIKMMSWAFSKGESYRRQWTTYVAYKNGGTYSFYSKLLKGHYTAKCK